MSNEKIDVFRKCYIDAGYNFINYFDRINLLYGYDINIDYKF